MDIDAKHGTKVTYIANPSNEQIRWGSHDDPTNLLEIGKRYTIDRTEIHSWHTKVFLQEFPDIKFNSVSFE